MRDTVSTLPGKLVLPAILLLAAVCGSGATITFTAGGVPCVPAGMCTAETDATTIDFETPYADHWTAGIATFSFAVGNMPSFVIGSVTGEYASPTFDNTRYLTVGSPNRAGEVSITFASPIDYYGLYFGSPDPYNVIRFYGRSADADPVATFTGTQLMPAAQSGDWDSAEFINFSVHNGTVERIVLTSSTAAFESDNHAYRAALSVASVPEPATFGLAGAFLGLAGCARVIRKRLKK